MPTRDAMRAWGARRPRDAGVKWLAFVMLFAALAPNPGNGFPCGVAVAYGVHALHVGNTFCAIQGLGHAGGS